jgi:concanavalin A-like lectin/glucanase superfamily protein
MRKFLLILFLFCCSGLSVGNAYAAFTFTNSSNIVTLADNAALTIPNADWTIAGFFRSSSTTSPISGGQRVFTWESSTGENFLGTLKASGGSGTSLNTIQIYSSYPSSTFDFLIQPAYTSDTNWHSYIAVRSSGTVTLYLDGTSIGTDTLAFGWDEATTWKFGNRGDGARPFVGDLAEWAKWDRALNAAEIAGLAARFSPNCFPGFTWFTPMIADYNEIKAGIVVTNSSSTITAHPRIISCN